MELQLETPYVTIKITEINPSHPIIKSILGFAFETDAYDQFRYQVFDDSHDIGLVYCSFPWCLINLETHEIVYTGDTIRILQGSLEPLAVQLIHLDDIKIFMSEMYFTLDIPVNNYSIDYKFHNPLLQLNRVGYNPKLRFNSIQKFHDNFFDPSAGQNRRLLSISLPGTHKLLGLDFLLNNYKPTSIIPNGRVYELINDVKPLKHLHLAVNTPNPTTDQVVCLYTIAKYYNMECKIHLNLPTITLNLEVTKTYLELEVLQG